MKNSARSIVIIAIILLAASACVAQTDTVIAIDLSKTMKVNDPAGNRFIGVDEFMAMFSIYKDTRGGLVSFGNSASVVFPLERPSFEAAKAGKYTSVLDKLAYEDWTELGQGLKVSAEALGASERHKSIILISDGIVEGNPDTRGMSRIQAKEQALRELWGDILPKLKSANVTVYTIGLVKVSDEGEPVLKRIAVETNGFYTKVDNPEEFPLIYNQILASIGQPSAVAKVTSERNSILLTPADDGVIIFGTLGFTVRAPNGLTYRTDRETPDTPVKQKFAEYSNQIGILFLGRPDNIEQSEKFWTGRWSVEDIKGTGEVTYFSNVRPDAARSLPLVREYYLYEFIPIEYPFVANPGFDVESYLSKCRAEYYLVPQAHSAARTESGSLHLEKNTFKGEQLLSNEGDYLLQIKIFYQDVEKSPPPVHLHVNKTPLVELLSPENGGTKGESFTIEAKENDAAFTSDSAEIRGLTGGKMTYTLRYGSDSPLSLPPVSEEARTYRVAGLEFRKPGDLEITGLLNASLVTQSRGEHGEPVIGHYNVKALVARRVKVEKSWLGLVLPWGASSIGVISGLLSIYAFVFQRRRFNLLDEAALTGKRTISLGPEHKSRMRWFMDRPAVSVGGPGSNADVVEQGLKPGGTKPVMQFTVDLLGKQHYITRTGDLDVYVNGRPLQENEQRPINLGQQIVVCDKSGQDLMKFKFAD